MNGSSANSRRKRSDLSLTLSFTTISIPVHDARKPYLGAGIDLDILSDDRHKHVEIFARCRLFAEGSMNSVLEISYVHQEVE